MLYTHILVPTDFSDEAKRALHYAIEEAKQYQARIQDDETELAVGRHQTG